MIIKLIQPKMNKRPMDTDLKTRMAPSLGILTIAKLFEKEHSVIIENENIRPVNLEEEVDIVGISITVDVMPEAIRLAKQFRSKGIPVVAGGIHMYCNIISTSRGCPFRCDFCYNSCKAYEKLYVNRPVEEVIEEIKMIGKKHIMFIDDNFIGNPKWTKELIRQIKPLKLKWNAAVSANIGDMPDLLDKMAESGCQSLFIGFESLNKTSLANVHKGQNQVAKFEKLVNEIHKRGIMINASFVFGLDGDDETTFDETLRWIVENRIETVTSHILTPYPGTKLYKNFLEQGRITDFDLSHYNTAHVVYQPKNMTAEQLYQGYIDIYKQIYSFKNIMRRLPKSKKQIMPYLAFNILYRKYGKFTEKICRLISFERIGRWGEWIAYKLKE
ncbi:MAG: radical SAM protein [Cellulosilyticum sp.]|nr:radical SAM protein [Cellulosilyticum sp.]